MLDGVESISLNNDKVQEVENVSVTNEKRITTKYY